MDKTTLKQLKPGRDHYGRSSKTYACHKYEDYNHEAFFKGTRTVFINFIY